jgi:hypothetical protein
MRIKMACRLSAALRWWVLETLLRELARGISYGCPVTLRSLVIGNDEFCY